MENFELQITDLEVGMHLVAIGLVGYEMWVTMA